MFKKQAHLHFIGIGGIGMSGIAKILAAQGYTISGCDKDIEQNTIIDLKRLGCIIYEGNNTSECHNETIDIVVYSSDIKDNHPEIQRARQLNIPTIRRALMLAELMRTKYSIAIAGSHGKTTTTSLISHILLDNKKDPTVIIGGHLKNISASAQFGNGDFLVAEADESDRSLIHLQATIAIITNIDFEHVDTYKDIDDIKTTFLQFLNNLPFYGFAIMCTDNIHVQSLLPLSHLKIIKYGIENEANFMARDIKLFPDFCQFTVIKDQLILGEVTLNMPGKHNILNALAAIALAYQLEIPFSCIVNSLRNFKGIERRFSFKGLYQAAEIFDDYGHHPEEIKQTLAVAKERNKNNLHIIFQPHRYTRTKVLWDDFVSVFMEQASLKTLIITDIHSASEIPIPEITGENLAKAIQQKNPSFAIFYVPLEAHFKSLKKKISTLIQPHDLILLQGAGKLNKLADYLIEDKATLETLQLSSLTNSSITTP